MGKPLAIKIKTRRSSLGFTVSELIVTLVILGILYAISLASFIGIINRAMSEIARYYVNTEIKQCFLAQAIELEPSPYEQATAPPYIDTFPQPYTCSDNTSMCAMAGEYTWKASIT